MIVRGSRDRLRRAGRRSRSTPRSRRPGLTLRCSPAGHEPSWWYRARPNGRYCARVSRGSIWTSPESHDTLHERSARLPGSAVSPDEKDCGPVNPVARIGAPGTRQLPGQARSCGPAQAVGGGYVRPSMTCRSMKVVTMQRRSQLPFTAVAGGRAAWADERPGGRPS